MEERRLELRVGLLVAAAVAAGVVLLYLLGELRLGRGASVYVDLAHAGGVSVGASVRVAGVRVGRVSGLELMPDRLDAEGRPLPVQFELDLPASILRSLHADARVLVATQGLLGEPYLEIEPGSPSAPPLPEKARLRGVDPPRTDLLAARLSDVLDHAASLLGEQQGLKHLVQRAGSAASRLDDLLADQGPSLAGLIADLRDASRDLKSAASSASATLGPGGDMRQALADLAQVSARLRHDLPAITASARKAAESLSSVAEQFGPEDAQRIKEALAQYQQAASDLSALAASAEQVLEGIQAGEGTLGALVKDPELYQELRALLSDLKRHPWKLLWKE